MRPVRQSRAEKVNPRYILDRRRTRSSGKVAISIWKAWVLCSLYFIGYSITPAFAVEPNIVVFLADDMGWGDIKINNPASRIPTPNIDKMAQEGMRFPNAHTSAAVCAPTRYAILTGNYQWRGRAAWGVWNFQDRSQILPGQKTIGDILQSRGYSTAFIGKLHMGGDFFARNSNIITRDASRVDFSRAFGNGPVAHGFNYSFPLLEGIQDSPYAYFENDRLYGDPNLLRQWVSGRYGNSVIPNTGIGMPYWDTSKVGPDLMSRAIGFLDRHKQQFGNSKPFFLYYASTAAHYPYTPPDSFLGHPVRGVTKLCARQDMVYELDVAVGLLMDKLRSQGTLKDTIFVFTSDNGGSPDTCGHDASGPDFSGYKGLVQEGGHRVPFLVRWGDGSNYTVPKGTVRNQLIGAHDLAATFAAITGASLGAEQAKDSFNMLPVWLGQRSDGLPVRDHLIAEARKEAKKSVIPPTFAYMEGDWKLVVRKDGANFTPQSLFDLRSDKAERSNLKNGQVTLVNAMLARFRQRYNGPRSAPILP